MAVQEPEAALVVVFLAPELAMPRSGTRADALRAAGEGCKKRASEGSIVSLTVATWGNGSRQGLLSNVFKSRAGYHMSHDFRS